MNFLQQHYNRARDAGIGHAMYVVANDIDDDRELCKDLRRNYEASKLTAPATEENTNA